MLTLIKDVTLYDPEYVGQRDMLLDSKSVVAIDTNIELNHKAIDSLNVIDASNLIAVPGFVDSLVHITGGGGEGGFTSRTPEVQLSDLTQAGITTLVGALGTDSITRTLTNVVAKVKELNQLGLSCYFYSGSYHLPIKTITNSLQTDIMLLQECIGVGEIAIADHRGSQLSYQELARVASDSRVGGMLSGKSGIVSIHVGDGDGHLSLLNQVVDKTNIPVTQFLPTHINRNQKLFSAGIDFVNRGGYIDLTTSTIPLFLEQGELKCSDALKQYLDTGADIEHITFSSDGHASLPAFNDEGDLTELQVGSEKTLFDEVRAAVLDHDIPLETALKVITSNPAKILKLPNKGHLKQGADADVVLLNKNDLTINSVFACGHAMVADGKALVRGSFE